MRYLKTKPAARCDGSCISLQPCRPNHVWSYDFVMARTLQEDAECPKGEAGQAMKLMGTEREAIVSKGREFLAPDRYQAMARVKDIEQGNWVFRLIGLGKTIFRLK